MNYLEALFKDISIDSKEVNIIRRKGWEDKKRLEWVRNEMHLKYEKYNYDDYEIYQPNIEMLEDDWEVMNDEE